MPAYARPTAPFLVLANLVAAIAVLLAGVTTVVVRTGGDDERAETAASDATGGASDGATTTVPRPVAVFPLTGLPAADPAVAARPALVVKIDNAEGSARPQMGLNQADVVVEETVEGSVTRLAAIFHSTDIDPVGPVRSARSTDIAVATPLDNPLFAWSGANADFAAAIRAAALVDVGVDAAPDSYQRRSDRRAPANLYSSTSSLYAMAPPGAPAPPPLFSFRPDGAPLGAGATPVGALNVNYGSGPGSAPVDYVWGGAAGVYARSQRGTPHVDEAGVRVAPQNVVVQFVDYVDTGYVDGSGSAVPEASLVGEGTAWVFTAGHLIEGRWVKPTLEAVTQFLDASGAPIGLTPGRTWVALAPPGGATVTG